MGVDGRQRRRWLLHVGFEGHMLNATADVGNIGK
jgi:hypothetical protein